MFGNSSQILIWLKLCYDLSWFLSVVQEWHNNINLKYGQSLVFKFLPLHPHYFVLSFFIRSLWWWVYPVPARPPGQRNTAWKTLRRSTTSWAPILLWIKWRYVHQNRALKTTPDPVFFYWASSIAPCCLSFYAAPSVMLFLAIFFRQIQWQILLIVTNTVKSYFSMHRSQTPQNPPPPIANSYSFLLPLLSNHHLWSRHQTFVFPQITTSFIFMESYASLTSLFCCPLLPSLFHFLLLTLPYKPTKCVWSNQNTNLYLI